MATVQQASEALDIFKYTRAVCGNNTNLHLMSLECGVLFFLVFNTKNDKNTKAKV